MRRIPARKPEQALDIQGYPWLQSPPPSGSAWMRDSPGSRTLRRPSRALTSLLLATCVAGGSLELPVAGDARAAGPARGYAKAKRPNLTLRSRVMQRLR